MATPQPMAVAALSRSVWFCSRSARPIGLGLGLGMGLGARVRGAGGSEAAPPDLARPLSCWAG